jgi:hypothetical protein
MATYKPLQSVTLTANTSSITFSGIDQSYTDLVISCNTAPSTNNYGIYMYFNGSTGSNYSGTVVHGNGSTATGTRFVSANTPGTSNWVGGQILGFANTLGANSLIININNYTSTLIYKGYLCKSYSGTNGVEISAGLWLGSTGSSKEPITSITLGAQSSSNLLAGSTFSLYGIKSGAPQALGGDLVTTDGNYWYHTFRSTQTFTPQRPLTVDYLVVAGGGGGGGHNSGGGGAGGLRSTVTQTGGNAVGVNLETASSLTGGTSYTITVGAGGAGGQDARGTAGSNSVFSTITSNGGAGGGGANSGQAPLTGGGSGGGGSQGGAGSAGTTNQGFAGGNSSSVNNSGGGGGGAGATGSPSSGVNGGNGGNGVATSISGSSVTYAGGGGGSSFAGSQGSGGSGGGGNAAYDSGAGAGTVNLGGGGGSSNRTTSSGGAGGSGIVIVRYPV